MFTLSRDDIANLVAIKAFSALRQSASSNRLVCEAKTVQDSNEALVIQEMSD
jgi:hypothetical protein